MVRFDCSVSHRDGVTLVAAYVRELDAPTRVDVRNRLDGPVWPPRSEGVPEAGWTDAGFAGVLAPGSHALGYATPASPAAPAAELVDAVPMPDADPVGELTDRPADVLRELGDPSPPADVVPVGPPSVDDASGPATSHSTASSTEPESPMPDRERAPRPSASDSAGATQSPVSDTAGSRVQQPGARADDEHARLPPALGPWMAAMERRTDTAESLAAAETVPEATAAVREAGGMTGVRELAEAADERQLRLVARRARRLADRRAGATVPVETLSSLA